MTTLGPDEILSELEGGFIRRKFAAGVLIAMIDFLESLDVYQDESIKDFRSFIDKYPRQQFYGKDNKKRANTLIIDVGGGKTASLRSFYDEAEHLLRATHKRFDYPSCAPHATQAWHDYVHWLDSLCGYSGSQASNLRSRVVDFVLKELPDQAFDPNSIVRAPPLFELFLEQFSFDTHKGELTGAAYQGTVFGFVRADNPHLQVEIDKVRTGSKRLQRVGDIDAWDGSRLAVTAEVKQYALGSKSIDQLASFAHETSRRASIGIVAALEIDDEARDMVEGLGLYPLSKEDMLNIVRLWDPMKQRTAVASLLYYIKHVEKSSSLGERVDQFFQTLEATDRGEIEKDGENS